MRRTIRRHRGSWSSEVGRSERRRSRWMKRSSSSSTAAGDEGRKEGRRDTDFSGKNINNNIQVNSHSPILPCRSPCAGG